VKTDGSGRETVFQNDTERAEAGIALDVPNGHLYTGSETWLFRINLDGTGRVNLVPTINQVEEVELDLIHGKIYWSEGNGAHNAIRCANLDGTDARTLIDVGYAAFFAGVAVDPHGGKLYCTRDSGGNDLIMVMNLDGSAQGVLYNVGGPGEINDLEIDPATGTLYFNLSSYAVPGIYQAPANGSGPVELVVTTPDGMGNGFHYDAVDRRFYYTYATPGGSEIRSVNLDGSDVRPMAQYVSTMYWMEAGHGIVVPGSGTEPPTITCPANMIVTADPGQCCAVVNFTVNATDDCGEVPVVCTPPSGSVFPKGTTTVTCTATDAGGQTATCTFTVTVNDTENPTITCPANIVTSTDAGQCSTVVTYTVTAADNCGGVSVTCTPPSGSTFPTGTTTVTATATDSVGNVATGSFTVTA
jgi:hypothetical protein